MKLFALAVLTLSLVGAVAHASEPRASSSRTASVTKAMPQGGIGGSVEPFNFPKAPGGPGISEIKSTGAYRTLCVVQKDAPCEPAKCSGDDAELTQVQCEPAQIINGKLRRACERWCTHN